MMENEIEIKKLSKIDKKKKKRGIERRRSREN